MNDHTHGSSCGFQHLLPSLAKSWIANGHHEPIGSQRSVPGQTQGSEHGVTAHKLIGGATVVEEAQPRASLPRAWPPQAQRWLRWW